jgi:hypothetical protein
MRSRMRAGIQDQILNYKLSSHPCGFGQYILDYSFTIQDNANTNSATELYLHGKIGMRSAAGHASSCRRRRLLAELATLAPKQN